MCHGVEFLNLFYQTQISLSSLQRLFNPNFFYRIFLKLDRFYWAHITFYMLAKVVRSKIISCKMVTLIYIVLCILINGCFVWCCGICIVEFAVSYCIGLSTLIKHAYCLFPLVRFHCLIFKERFASGIDRLR